MEGACALTIYPLAVLDGAAAFCARTKGQAANKQRRTNCNRNLIKLSLMKRGKADGKSRAPLSDW
jgi:hypothetical protein